MADERIEAIGFAISCPAMSGAEPCTGSNKPCVPGPIEAEGSIPIDPVSMAAASDRMSPNTLPVTMTSNCVGLRISIIEAASIYRCDSSTSGYSRPTSITTSRQSCMVSSTFDLSTEHSLPRRPCAALNPAWAIRAISSSV